MGGFGRVDLFLLRGSDGSAKKVAVKRFAAEALREDHVSV